jgi:hypothetical protein
LVARLVARLAGCKRAESEVGRWKEVSRWKRVFGTVRDRYLLELEPGPRRCSIARLVVAFTVALDAVQDG